jgi:ubiquinone/menaquinone biosynthesis C-methylase UbiE
MLDNLEEYTDPDLYDAENDLFKDDFNVFVGLKDHGSALDLACGTGRLTVALAKSGLPCIGLDVSESMLERAQKKSDGRDIAYKQGDMRDFHLNQKFDLITMAGNAF